MLPLSYHHSSINLKMGGWILFLSLSIGSIRKPVTPEPGGQARRPGNRRLRRLCGIHVQRSSRESASDLDGPCHTATYACSHCTFKAFKLCSPSQQTPYSNYRDSDVCNWKVSTCFNLNFSGQQARPGRNAGPAGLS